MGKPHSNRLEAKLDVGHAGTDMGPLAVESPRRRWYESEESWKKRKRRETKHEGKRKPAAVRKRWEHSAPVTSLRDSENRGERYDKQGVGVQEK